MICSHIHTRTDAFWDYFKALSSCFKRGTVRAHFFLYRALFSSVTLWTHGTNPVHPRTEWNDWSRAWARLTYFCPIAERDILRSLLTPSLAGSHIEPLMCLCPGRKTTQSHTVLGEEKRAHTPWNKPFRPTNEQLQDPQPECCLLLPESSTTPDQLITSQQ